MNTRTGGLRLTASVTSSVEIGDRVVNPIDQGSRPRRAPVAAMVERVDRIALGDQRVGDVVVAVAVFTGAVDDHDHCLGADRRRPGLPEDAATTGSAEEARGLL